MAKRQLYEWKYLGAAISVTKRRMQRSSIAALLRTKIEMASKSFERCLNYALYDTFETYLGKPGPVTFSGTPAEVIQKLRRWQKGLEP